MEVAFFVPELSILSTLDQTAISVNNGIVGGLAKIASHLITIFQFVKLQMSLSLLYSNNKNSLAHMIKDQNSP